MTTYPRFSVFLGMEIVYPSSCFCLKWYWREMWTQEFHIKILESRFPFSFFLTVSCVRWALVFISTKLEKRLLRKWIRCVPYLSVGSFSSWENLDLMAFLPSLILFNLLSKIKMVNYNIEIQGLNLHRVLSFSETSIKACVSPLKRKKKSNPISVWPHLQDRKWSLMVVLFSC